ncbi:MAG: tRNA preQ1(34) S-adenosylmethionine ribosyltransferase-isomerase QueA [Clostridiales bacterium]|jgi:S-adenosylmethionine:tRNA ribosyltransferase-isomerase|nr:tRNA preQ1(34) S-adenosylmethionine ribosyltransferase-isomerase QueA [Clostridiales bacterium]HOK81423.1 tRNA preQ1(34) S-adenosylmethionine ribosyltransferase-isomerase QueA [Clostridia bacterium]HOL60723.1 tRNA preQ1(34) S-adenosylmethionine ribosyltransferase-isomerase QueA [Clostridia bacterium]HPO53298.1 tRNA preQ1(34) S-adenosylmethionine ribosyltransferase-isomerase QueA [Clostridia bacterium]
MTTNLKKSDFFYDLPEELIAQTPATPRDSSRLLYYNRAGKEVRHLVFRDIVNILQKGDLLVVNNTKVIPARLAAFDDKGREYEALLLKRLSYDTWETLLKPAKKAKIGSRLVVNEELNFDILSIGQNGVRVIKFNFNGVFEDILSRVGSVPLPPYITEKLEDKERYQTVYAKTEGSSAAPTAGLHFTNELIETLKQKGVEFVEVLLHVGLGTFRPVKEENIANHVMHSEYYSVSPGAAEKINAAKRDGRRVIAVGTTSVRTLESVTDPGGVVQAGSGETDIFIYPPYKFKAVDGIITNFHLPESTLIMLVSAFAGRETTLGLYRMAVEERYRFFSFGDAMLIL